MSGFSELINNFEKTRDYVRDFFIYGFKVRNDFDRKSRRTYDDEKRRVQSWLGDYLRYDSSVRGKQISISVDSGRISENPLYKAYRSKSFTDNDIKLHFLIVDILCDNESLSIREIAARLDEQFGEIFEEQTIRNKLKEYVEEGIIVTEKKGKTSCFSLSPDRADELLSEYEGLSDAVKFFSETQEFGIVGNSILASAGLSNDLFVMKHNYIVHTLEDIIIPPIITAIREKRCISCHIFSLRSNAFSDNEKIVPVQLLSSVQTGRRYLIGYSPLYGRFNSFRLDTIKSVTVGDVCENFDDIMEMYQRNYKKSFGVSFGSGHDDRNSEPLKITLCIDEEKEKYILERLEREKRNGIITRTGNNLYTLTIDCFDPNEPMQWIKTFIGRIKAVEGGNETVRNIFHSDIRRMAQIYGGEENEHIQ